MAQRGILLLLVVVVVGDSLGLTRRQARQASQTEEEELAGGNNRNLAHHHIILSLKGQIVILGQRVFFLIFRPTSFFEIWVYKGHKMTRQREQ